MRRATGMLRAIGYCAAGLAACAACAAVAGCRSHDPKGRSIGPDDRGLPLPSQSAQADPPIPGEHAPPPRTPTP